MSSRVYPRTGLLLVNFGTTSHPSRAVVWKHFCRNPKPWVTCSAKSGHPVRNKGNFKILLPLYQLVAKHRFALCPRGNGMDTHRIYEALELRTIPIVLLGQSTALDALYRRLPVLGVTDWSQVTEEFLRSKSRFWPEWSLRQEFQYWKQMIRSHTAHSIVAHNVADRQAITRQPLPIAKTPYPVSKVKWGSTCSATGSLRAASRSKWRVALSSDTNPNYLAFLPSVVDHWKSYGLEPVVALVVENCLC